MEHFIYIADPMCSWCYGFGPQLSRFMAQFPDAQIDVMVGGLRAYATAPLSAAARVEIRSHWDRVETQTGLPFCAAGQSPMDAPGFIYDTEPACRAVVAVRYAQQQPPVHISADQAPAEEAVKGQSPHLALDFFHALQVAWYRDGRDITQQTTLAALATEQGLDETAFLTQWASPALQEYTRQDFLLAQKLGIRGFPALIGLYGGNMHLITSGFHYAEQLWEIVDEIRQSTENAE
ncbi:DsbA family protein [Parvibium lacunae]|uniref:DsbA family protein n=1 Tax=Parvibium lacunae TaxID=1888893 RepID=A0A368L1N4_9BURK|nr:DsbA family protein [Parvibium lacunae]RCS57465.1 DsbA family protein [Parvibium lacunae]